MNKAKQNKANFCKILVTGDFYFADVFLNPIRTGVGGGGGFYATQDLNPLLLRIAIVSTVFLLREFSSSLFGNNLVLLGFGS